MKVTIKDVAKEAGVSPSTVSRALQNNPRISQAVRDRIRQIADDMGFRPNQMARSLVSRQTRVIGVVFPANLSHSLSHPFYPKALQGLGQVAAERNHYVLMGTGKEGQSTTDVVNLLADSGYVSGLVLLAAQEELPPLHGLPAVVIGRPPAESECYHVDNNNISVGEEATRYLIDRGHRKIMLLGYDKQFVVTSDRRKGYEQALEKSGIPFRREWVVPTRFLNDDTDQEVLLSIFRDPDRPTAVVCMDDNQAIALCACLQSLGLSVPEDVSLISFNNTQAGKFNNPPLTSFDVNPYQLGASAMEMVLDLIAEKECPLCVEVPFLLKERGSVARIN